MGEFLKAVDYTQVANLLNIIMFTNSVIFDKTHSIQWLIMMRRNMCVMDRF